MNNLALGLVCFLMCAAGHAAENGYHLGDQAPVLDDRVMYTIGASNCQRWLLTLFSITGCGGQ